MSKRFLVVLRRILFRSTAANALEVCKRRLVVVEDELVQCKSKNRQLVEQLEKQKSKTRELYQRTKEYAQRLNQKS